MQTKLVKRLHDKKERTESGLFLVEGEKSVLELLSSDFEIIELYTTQELFTAHEKVITQSGAKYYIVDAPEIASLSTLENNQSALALVRQKAVPKISDILATPSPITLALDGIRDPGNLGTLIRIADWYGLGHVLVSSDTTELYNPKTIAASMGSFARVQCIYVDLPATLRNHFQNNPILIADMQGNPADSFNFPPTGTLVIGSESHGISQDIKKLATDAVTIRRHGKAESLNAAMAGAIILDRWINR